MAKPKFVAVIVHMGVRAFDVGGATLVASVMAISVWGLYGVRSCLSVVVGHVAVAFPCGSSGVEQDPAGAGSLTCAVVNFRYASLRAEQTAAFGLK